MGKTMNIESVLHKMNMYTELVHKSGFQRDIAEAIKAISHAQNQTLDFMKRQTENLNSHLINAEANSLPSELDLILKDTEPFTNLNVVQAFENIFNDPEITAPEYHNTFSQHLNKLTSAITQNSKEIESSRVVLEKFVTEKDGFNTDTDQGVLSLVFKDAKSTGTMEEFSKILHQWNMILCIYHNLLKSESPKQIKLVEIQNGSIDVIFNIDLDIAINLADLIRLGFEVFGGYLVFKSSRENKTLRAELMNKELTDLQAQTEQAYLNNISDALVDKIQEQHTEQLKKDKKITKTAVDKKISQVVKLISNHIIKGNDVKFLTHTQNDVDDVEAVEELEVKLSNSLREASSKARLNFNELTDQEKQKLIQHYSEEK